MATITNTQLLAPTVMGSSDAVIYAPLPLSTAKISRAVFSNPDTSAHTITVNITTGTSTAANQVINARTVSPGETYVSPELAGAVIPAGSSIRGLASSAGQIVVTLSGIIIQ